MLPNKDEKQAESRMWWRRQRISQDVSPTLQPRLASKDNDITPMTTRAIYQEQFSMEMSAFHPIQSPWIHSAFLPQRRPREVTRTNQGLWGQNICQNPRNLKPKTSHPLKFCLLPLLQFSTHRNWAHVPHPHRKWKAEMESSGNSTVFSGGSMACYCLVNATRVAPYLSSTLA